MKGSKIWCCPNICKDMGYDVPPAPSCASGQHTINCRRAAGPKRMKRQALMSLGMVRLATQSYGMILCESPKRTATRACASESTSTIRTLLSWRWCSANFWIWMMAAPKRPSTGCPKLVNSFSTQVHIRLLQLAQTRRHDLLWQLGWAPALPSASRASNLHSPCWPAQRTSWWGLRQVIIILWSERWWSQGWWRAIPTHPHPQSRPHLYP